MTLRHNNNKNSYNDNHTGNNACSYGCTSPTGWRRPWLAAKRQVAAFSTLRTSFTNWIHLVRVAHTNSPTRLSTPCITIFHFLRWTSFCWVWCARDSVIRAVWSDIAGSTSVGNILWCLWTAGPCRLRLHFNIIVLCVNMKYVQTNTAIVV